ncbi:MAG: TonB-dependent receptor [Pseudomonadota bacterium]
MAHQHSVKKIPYKTLYRLAIVYTSILAASEVCAEENASLAVSQLVDEPAINSSVKKQQSSDTWMEDVVVTASRAEQRQFDAPAAVNAVQMNPSYIASPLVNVSEMTQLIPGVQIKNRQNYAQDLQLSVRGFGTRSTFGVRGVRILVDGIPATMPDGQGQVATASLTSARRIEVLRGPLAQMYGNAAGGVLQIFTQDPPTGSKPVFSLSGGVGSDGQYQSQFSIAGGNATGGGLIDIARYQTEGYRDHSAAERTQINTKLLIHPSSATRITAIFNRFDQPEAQDPLGLSHTDFNNNPRQVIPNAITFNTRKSIEQNQLGILLEHHLSSSDSLNARIYGGTRQVNQTLAFTTNGVVDLDRDYKGIGLNWSHKAQIKTLPIRWIAGVEIDDLKETRKGFDNIAGNEGALRRYEDDRARNTDFFTQIDWTLNERWQAITGVRFSTVKFKVDDYFNSSAMNTSGQVKYSHTSPVLGLVWHANDSVNVYGNIGKGFETPTLAESAYRPNNQPGPNFSLMPSKSIQAELGIKMHKKNHTMDAAIFETRSQDEIVSQASSGGRSTFQNIESVRRRGFELSWKAQWKMLSTSLSYTFLDARFTTGFINAQGAVAAGNRLPGSSRHSIGAEAEKRFSEKINTAVEIRADSKVYVNDANTDAAPGYAVVNTRAGYEFHMGDAKLFLYGRIDNIFNKNYAGSVIVNDTNQRFFEPAPKRRFFVGLRTVF